MACLQGTLRAHVDSLLPAAVGEGERARLVRTLLLAVLVAQGVPTLPQDAVADAAAARFVCLLLRLRHRPAPVPASADGGAAQV